MVWNFIYLGLSKAQRSFARTLIAFRGENVTMQQTEDEIIVGE